MQVTRAGNNHADFLLDGDAYFERLHQTLESIRATGGGGNQFVRMAFWQFSPDTFLPACTSLAGAAMQGRYLCDMLENIAALGIPVQLIAWYGTTAFNTVNAEMSSNWAMNRWVQDANHRNGAVVGYHPIQMFMESYGGRRHVGMSTHQKIVIACTGPLKEAFVGGMNLAQKYLSSDQHDPVNDWHDTALRVTGAIVDDIEAEWLRRWNKQNPAPAPNGVIIPAAPVMGGMTMSMFTTNIEANPAETDIRTHMLARIAGAAHYAYLENYALTDPELVTALAARRAPGVGQIPIIPMVNHPRNRTQDGFEIFSYMMFYTFVELGLADFVSFDAVDTWTAWLRRAPVNYPTAGVVGPVVQKIGFQPGQTAVFNPVNGFRLQYADATGAQRRVWFRDIWNLTPNGPVMYGPQNNHARVSDHWTYLHSKLAMFDDQYVLVGTSNWTYRSMQYDGEITLEVDDPTNVFPQAVRAQLFNHWQMPTAAVAATAGVGAAWVGDATANPGNLGTNGLARAVPLQMDDFINPTSVQAWRSLATNGTMVSAYM